MGKLKTPKTRREITEIKLIQKFGEHISPFNPKEHHPLVDSFKDGSAGHSTSAFALYSNGCKQDSYSLLAPFGLLYHDGKVMFSIGCFRREMDGEYYLVLTAPKGKQVSFKDRMAVTIDFVKSILEDKEIEIAGTYVRFLDLEHYLLLLNAGFLPAKEHPWHPEAPEEDEHLNYSRVNLRDFFDEFGTIRERYPRLQTNRFSNYLVRNNSRFLLHKTHSKEDEQDFNESRIVRSIISQHFSFMKKEKKDISSCAEDYLNLADPFLWNLPTVYTYIGWLHDPKAGSNCPVSFFLGEKTDDKTFAMYCMITLRGQAVCGNLHGGGKSALIKYSHAMLFQELSSQGMETVDIGGSEHPDLNWSKRKWGAELNPTYWVVKLR